MLDHIVALRTEIDIRVASYHVRFLPCTDITFPHSDLGRPIPPAWYIRLMNSPSLFHRLPLLVGEYAVSSLSTSWLVGGFARSKAACAKARFRTRT